MVTSSIVTDPSSRRSLLDAYADAVEEARQIGDGLTDAGTDDAAFEEFAAALEAAGDHRRLYQQNLPVRTIARCPFTSLAVLYPIDDAGLDGPFWDFQNPVRVLGIRPGTCYGITGAMSVTAGFEYVSHIAIVGPSIPYVIPRLLEVKGSKAVLSSLPVGEHTGYVITYFAPPGTEGEVPTTDEWGTARWQGTDADGESIWTSTYKLYQETDDAPLHEERDVDLAPWIAAGRLGWVAPGDTTATTHWEVDDCPYLGLKGTVDDQWVMGVWTT